MDSDSHIRTVFILYLILNLYQLIVKVFSFIYHVFINYFIVRFVVYGFGYSNQIGINSYESFI